MSRFDKLLDKIDRLDNDLRFSELKKVLEYYGYECRYPLGGSSQCVFRKRGEAPVVIPYKSKIDIVYVRMVKDVVEMEKRNG